MSNGHITKYLKKKDGLQIFFRFWAGRKDMPVMVLLHGLGSHSLRFDTMAKYFQKRKFNIYAFDFAGFGKSQTYKGHIESINTYINETLAVVKLIKMEFPNNVLILVGEDMGGVVGLYFAKYYQKLIDFLILLSPAVKYRLHLSFKTLITAMLNSVLNKFHPFDLPFTNEMLTRDFKMQRMLQDDELNTKIVTVKFYFAILEALKKLNKAASQVTVPAYVLQAGNDLLVNANSVKDVFCHLGSPVKELTVLPDYYHSLSIDKGRDLVFQLMEKWIYKILFLTDSLKGNQ